MAITTNTKLVTVANLGEFKTKYTDTYIGEIKKDGSIQTVKDYVDQEVGKGGSGSVVTIEEVTTGLASDILKAYEFYQGVLDTDDDTAKAAKKIGTINLAKDLVVTAGVVETYDASSLPTGVTEAGTYLKLTIANQTDPVYINVKDLCDIYTSGSAATDEVVIAVDSSTNKITATITDGTVTKDQLVTTLSTEITTATTNIGVESKDETTPGAGDAVVATGIFKRLEDLESLQAADNTTDIDALFA